MATIFLSYSTDDRKLAQSFQSALEKRGHTVRRDTTELLIGDEWRSRLTEALREADALISLLSESSLASQFVIAELGAARAFGMARGTLILPVLVKLGRIPLFVQDIHALTLASRQPPSIDEAADRLDRDIRSHLKRLRRFPQVFISHRHKDKELVAALIRLLDTAFDLDKTDLRCTSVPPYKLPAGERTSDRLKTEIARAKAVLGILTPDTKESQYVLFELGAAWGEDTVTFPLLAKGARPEDIPPPIYDRHPLKLTDPSDCHQLIDDLADGTKLRRRAKVVSKRLDEAVRDVVRLAAAQLNS